MGPALRASRARLLVPLDRGGEARWRETATAVVSISATAALVALGASLTRGPMRDPAVVWANGLSVQLLGRGAGVAVSAALLAGALALAWIATRTRRRGCAGWPRASRPWAPGSGTVLLVMAVVGRARPRVPAPGAGGGRRLGTAVAAATRAGPSPLRDPGARVPGGPPAAERGGPARGPDRARHPGGRRLRPRLRRLVLVPHGRLAPLGPLGLRPGHRGQHFVEPAARGALLQGGAAS